MQRQILAAVSLIGVLVVGRVATRLWGANPEVRAPGHGPVSSFIMTIEGPESGTEEKALAVVGEAGFRRTSSKSGAEFSLELGSRSHDAAVLFAAEGLGPHGPGIYEVDDRPGSTALHALVVTGTPTRPTGVYRAESGTVTLREAGGGQMEGSFELWARGFNAEHPLQDDLVITAAGSFLATER